MEQQITDGRRARGLRKRAEIIEATLRVVQRDGAAGVTHRSVAREAGVTTSLTTYHFATLDDLLVAALSTVGAEYEARLRAGTDEGRDGLSVLAGLIAESGADGRGRALAERELSTLAARRPALRPIARRWREAVAEIARERGGGPDAVAALVATADGLCAGILLEGADHTPARVVAVLEQAMGLRGADASEA